MQNDTEEGIVGINVTPLVDITLVLLIIFMVVAKMVVSQSLPLDLPKAASGTDVQTVFSIELYANGEMAVDQKKLPNDDALFPLAREGHTRNADLRAVIKADGTVLHQRVIHVLDLLKQAGVSKIAFGVTPIAPEPGAVSPASSR
ncbi:MAG TPA: biopolymer transporter ExbD [Polyangiaceae bacterium]